MQATDQPMKFCIFVPSLNVGHSVRRVLQGITQAVLARTELVLVMDNGSSDNTIAEVQAFLKETVATQVRLYRNDANYSLGGSTLLAMELAMQAGCDFLISMHSDGQADPADLERFIAAASRGVDFVCGSRLMRGSGVAGYPLPRLWGNHVLSWLQRVLFDIEVRDTAAYLAFNLHTVRELPFRELKSDMGYPTALILVAAMRRRIHCVEFPIAWGRIISTNVNPFAYAISHVSRLLMLRVRGEQSILVLAQPMTTRQLTASDGTGHVYSTAKFFA